VADTDNNRIQKFSPDGGLLSIWGSAGNRQFHDHRGIAIGGNGNVYVTDSGNNRVQKLSSSGEVLAMWGSRGAGDEKFYDPQGIAVDRSGNFYVADTINHGVKKFSPDGVFLTKWGSEGEEPWDLPGGSEDGQLLCPFGVAVDRSGNVYVADTYNYHIQKFSPWGWFLTKWGSEGSGDGEFKNPTGIAVDGSGNVYVTDIDNNCIQKFSSDGVFLTSWGSFGSEDGQFNHPAGVAVEGNGNIYVADTDNNRIQKFSSDGVFLTSWGSYGSEDGQFNRPSGVAVDRSGNVYVADSGNDRIQKFTYPNSTGIPPSEDPYATPGTLVIGEIRGKMGKEIRVPVMLQDVAAAISAFGFEFIYDASVLEYAGFESGDLAESFQGESFRSLNLDSVDSGRVEVEGLSVEVTEVEGLGIEVTIEGDIPKGDIPKETGGCLVWLKFKVKGGVKGNCYPLKIGSMWDDLNHGISIEGRFCLDQCDGDINGDGSVTPQDALIAFGCFLDHTGSDHNDSDHTDSCPECADIDDSGDITPADALCILREYLGAPSCLD